MTGKGKRRMSQLKVFKMGRIKRKWSPYYFDHIVVRGNNRQAIFKEAADFAEFFRVLHYVHG